MKTIPLYKPFISGNEINSIERVLKSGRLSRGKEVEEFEKEFSKYVKKKYAVAVNSGTSGLHLAVKSLGLREGDEVITTPYSFIASSNVLLYEKIIPVFVDIDPLTLNINPEEILKKINSKTKAILIVDVFGYPCYSKKIKGISKKYKIPIIEDACEAIGSPSKKFPVGIADIAVYGFFENKQITTAGEGGIIVTNNKSVADYCKSARDQGSSNKKNWIDHVILGYNYRMTEIQAAFGREQLKNISLILREREKISKVYKKHLSSNKKIKLPFSDKYHKRSWFTYYLTFQNKLIRNKVCMKLSEKKIPFHIYFPEIHLFPFYKKFGYGKGSFPICEMISNSTITLPFFIGMKNKEVKFISETILSAIE